MKYCPSCVSNLDTSFFNKHSKRKDGLQDFCRLCTNTLSRKWKELNKERYRESVNRYRTKHPEIAKKYYKENKDEIIKYINKKNREKDFGLLIVYLSMTRRCNYPSQPSYKHYGGRGICVDWKSYKEFRIDMYGSYIKSLNKHGKKNTTIERIDVDGNYCKENCKWATMKEQQNNKRNNLHYVKKHS